MNILFKLNILFNLDNDVTQFIQMATIGTDCDDIGNAQDQENAKEIVDSNMGEQEKQHEGHFHLNSLLKSVRFFNSRVFSLLYLIEQSMQIENTTDRKQLEAISNVNPVEEPAKVDTLAEIPIKNANKVIDELKVILETERIFTFFSK